jgi:hypothetical protein
MVRFPTGSGNFSLHNRVHTGSGAHPASCSMHPGYPGVKRPKREVDYSPPSSAEDKNAWNSTSYYPIPLHVAVLR